MALEQVQFDQRAFRNALGHFPTGVAVVTAHAGALSPVAMTVTSFNAVSLEPPLVLFSIRRDAASLPSLLAADSFGISVLRQDQSALSSRFANGRSEKWAGIEPVRGTTGCPLVGPCLALRVRAVRSPRGRGSPHHHWPRGEFRDCRRGRAADLLSWPLSCHCGRRCRRQRRCHCGQQRRARRLSGCVPNRLAGVSI